MKKIAIIGANGQLGQQLSKFINSKNFKSIELTRQNLDLTNLTNIETVLEDKLPDFVINCAAITDVNYCQKNVESAFLINSTATKKIAKTCNNLGIKLIHISTDFVFDGKDETVKTFKSLANPISVYGQSKLEGEIGILGESGLSSLILRTGALYGGYKSNFVKFLFENLIRGQQIGVATNQFNQPTNINYLCEIILNVITNDFVEGLYHATSAGLVSKYDFAIEICQLLDLPQELVLAVDFKDLSGSSIRPQFSNLIENRVHDLGLPNSIHWRDDLMLNSNKLKFMFDFEKKAFRSGNN